MSKLVPALVGALMLGWVGVVSAAQPVTLTDAQMDAVTAGGAFIPAVGYKRTGPSFNQQISGWSWWAIASDVDAAKASRSWEPNTEAIFNLANQERAKAGVRPLARSQDLAVAAQMNSNDMAQKNAMGHTPDLRGVLVSLSGSYPLLWNSWGENVHQGYKTPTEVMHTPAGKGWMTSPPHRANILNPVYTHAGVGFATSATSKAYWTLVLARLAGQ